MFVEQIIAIMARHNQQLLMIAHNPLYLKEPLKQISCHFVDPFILLMYNKTH